MKKFLVGIITSIIIILSLIIQINLINTLPLFGIVANLCICVVSAFGVSSGKYVCGIIRLLLRIVSWLNIWKSSSDYFWFYIQLLELHLDMLETKYPKIIDYRWFLWSLRVLLFLNLYQFALMLWLLTLILVLFIY